jgi:hypothetical protein
MLASHKLLSSKRNFKSFPGCSSSNGSFLHELHLAIDCAVIAMCVQPSTQSFDRPPLDSRYSRESSQSDENVPP